MAVGEVFQEQYWELAILPAEQPRQPRLRSTRPVERLLRPDPLRGQGRGTALGEDRAAIVERQHPALCRRVPTFRRPFADDAATEQALDLLDDGSRRCRHLAIVRAAALKLRSRVHNAPGMRAQLFTKVSLNLGLAIGKDGSRIARAI